MQGMTCPQKYIQRETHILAWETEPRRESLRDAFGKSLHKSGKNWGEEKENNETMGQISKTYFSHKEAYN